MMNYLRIFVSSPGDVGEERKLTERIIARLQRSFAGTVELQPYFWEHEPLLATSSFQPQILRPSATDIVICILWTRLGSRLPDDYVTVEGQPPPTGTEFEFEDAVTSWNQHRRPDLLVYVKKARRRVDLDDDESVMQEYSRQKRQLETFIAKWFFDPEKGHLTKAFHTFEGLSTFEEQLEKHLRKLIEQKIGLVREVAARPTWSESPFRGLDFFDFEHAPIFFGRTKAIGEVIDAMRGQAAKRSAFVCVLGMSGGGKSSLIRAGILPLLVEPGVIEGIAVWRRAIFRPSDSQGDLFEGLAAALLGPTALPELTADNATEGELAAMLRNAPKAADPLIKGGLAQVVGDLCAQNLANLAGPNWTEEYRRAYVTQFKLQTRAQLVLFVDQFEEIFTLERLTKEERDKFVEALGCLARCGRVWIIASMRSDFFTRCPENPELVELMRNAGQYQLLPPSAGEIGQMIVEPAGMAGLRFEKDSANIGLEEILRDTAAADRRYALPLLEFTLGELYKECGDQRILTYAAYEKIGRLEGAIANKAEATFAVLSDTGKSAFDTIFRSLVTADVSEEERFTRKWAPKASLNQVPGGNDFIENFLKARLLVSDDAAGIPSVTVAHEALLRSWPRLQEWLKKNQEYLRIQSRVAHASDHWDEMKEDSDLLLSPGRQLVEAEDALKQQRAVFSDKQLAYIDASSRAARRKAQRRRIVTQIVVASMTVISCVALFFLVQSRRAEATARESQWQAETANVKAQDALKQNQLTTFSVYQTAYKAAKDQKQSTDGLFWLRAAIDLGKPLGLDTRDLELALTGESSLASQPTWRSSTPLPLLRAQSFHDGTVWVSFALPGVPSDVTYNSFAIGRRTADGWSFDKSITAVGTIGASAPWNAGKQMLAICDHKLTGFDVTTLKSVSTYPEGNASLDDTLCLTPDESSVFVIGGGKLQQVDPSTMKLVKVWPLDLPGKTMVYDILLSPANQLAILRTYDGQNRNMVIYSLKDSKVVLSLPRQRVNDNGFAADDRHLVFGGNEGGTETPGELVCVDLRDLTKVWRISCPWKSAAILSLGSEEFVVAHTDGNIRHWGYDGTLRSKQSMPGVDDVSLVWPVSGGFLLSHDGKFSFRTDLTNPDESSTPSVAFAKSIAMDGDNLVSATSGEKINLTNETTGTSISSWAVAADDLAIDPGDNRLFARNGSHLTAYDLKTRQKIATTEVDTATPLVFAPERGALIAAPSQGGGLYAFDPIQLNREERIAMDMPTKLGLCHGGLWMVNVDTTDRELKLAQYAWLGGTVPDQITVDCPAGQVNDIDFNLDDHRLLLGRDDGSVSVFEIKQNGPDSSFFVNPKPRFISPDLEKVLKVWRIDPNTACFAHADGQLDIARVNQDGGYTLAEILHPFGTCAVAQALLIGPGELILRANDGEIGRFVIASSSTLNATPNPLQNANYTCDCEDFYAYPDHSYVKVCTPDGKETLLQGTKVTDADFDQTVTNPSRTVLAATDSGGLVYFWPVDKGHVDNSALMTKSVAPNYDYVCFVDDKTLAAINNGQVSLVDLGAKLQTSIRWTQNIPSQALPLKNFAGICCSHGSVVVAFEEVNKLFVFDGKSGTCSEINVPETPRSLCTAGANGDKILVGGDNTVAVVDLNKNAVDHQIKLPATVSAYTYYVRSMLAIPETNFVLFGCGKGIAYADLNRTTTFMMQPIDDSVWGMNLSGSRNKIFWRGQDFYGCVSLANMLQPVPDKKWIESTFAMRLDDNSRLQPIPFPSLIKEEK